MLSELEGGRNGMPRTGNGEGEFAGVFFEKALHECTLSCTARAGDDHWSKLLDCWISIRAGFGAVKGLWGRTCAGRHVVLGTVRSD